MREEKRLYVATQYEVGKLTGAEVARILGVSLRQARRIIAAYREEGAAGLAHGNRGRPSPRRIEPKLREQIIWLARTQYSDYNDTHLTERLLEEHSIRVSRSTLRRIRRAMGQGSPRKRRSPRHLSRRERRSQSGIMLQLDGSPHSWLEGRGPKLTLLAAVDDATGELVAAIFREKEDAAGYFQLMRDISISHGLPMEVYTDKHTIFRSPKSDRLSVAEKLEGKRPQSQFQRLLDELSIEQIPASSPQAKGRVERLFGTLQDRLVKELREATTKTIEEANKVLRDYMAKFNARFTVDAREEGAAYVPWPQNLDRDHFFCFKYRRTVASDNTISFSGHRLQIPPGTHRVSYARARVDVYHRLDGSLAILYEGETLVVHQPANPNEPVRVKQFTPATTYQPAKKQLTPNPIPAPKKHRQPYRPPADHPWRRSYKRPRRQGSAQR